MWAEPAQKCHHVNTAGFMFLSNGACYHRPAWFPTLQAVVQWQSALDKCKTVWKELRGVPLLPLANGTAGSFPASFSLGGRQRFILGTRRQQGLLPQLKGRFVHLKATRRLARFFERDEFLEVGLACSPLTVSLTVST